MDRVPILALTGQVQSQVIGPGAFQEIRTAAAFEAVSEWSQTVIARENASELMALAIKHAVVNRDVAHLILPDDSQELPGLDDPPPRPRTGRVSEVGIAAPQRELERAVDLLTGATRSRDHCWKRRQAISHRDHSTRRADRCADHHHVQGEGHGQ